MNKLWSISKERNTASGNLAEKKAKAFVLSLLHECANGTLCNVTDWEACRLAVSRPDSGVGRSEHNIGQLLT